MTLFMLIGFCAIVASLCFALYFMVKKDKDDSTHSKQMAKALTYRIGISVLLFACVLMAWLFGWIAPTGIVLKG